jgi:hypothetical protein
MDFQPIVVEFGVIMGTDIGWSFCIISTNNTRNNLLKVVTSIANEFISHRSFEIIVVGGEDLRAENFLGDPTIKHIKFSERRLYFGKKNIIQFVRSKNILDLFSRTGAICIKKNLASKVARYDKLCFLHDYVSLDAGWGRSWVQFGYDWDVCMTKIYNNDGVRHRDWLNLDYPGVGLGHESWSGSCLMPYDITTDYMYIPGMYFCVKRNFFLKYPLNKKLFWGEGEDIEWSLRIRALTRFVINTNASVTYVKQKPVDNKLWLENEERFLAIINK